MNYQPIDAIKQWQKACQTIREVWVKTFLLMSPLKPMEKGWDGAGGLQKPRNNPFEVCAFAADEARLADYVRVLKTEQFLFFPAKGKFANIEFAYIAYNISLADAQRLGRRYDQREIVFGRVKCDGKITFQYFRKSQSEYAQTKDRNRNYVFGEERVVCLPLTAPNLPDSAYALSGCSELFAGMAYVNDLMEERSVRYWAYKQRFKRFLRESLDDRFTPWGRRQRRADLWGKHYDIECEAYQKAFPENENNQQ